MHASYIFISAMVLHEHNMSTNVLCNYCRRTPLLLKYYYHYYFWLLFTQPINPEFTPEWGLLVQDFITGQMPFLSSNQQCQAPKN